jgi:hypothetical protein
VADDLKRLKWAMDHPDKFQALVWRVFNDENSQDEDVKDAITEEIKAENQRSLAPISG